MIKLCIINKKVKNTLKAMQRNIKKTTIMHLPLDWFKKYVFLMKGVYSSSKTGFETMFVTNHYL